jgi:hypothetical protein
MQKDALYRLINNEDYPWRRLLYAVAKKFKQLANPGDKPVDRVTALIDEQMLNAKQIIAMLKKNRCASIMFIAKPLYQWI